MAEDQAVMDYPFPKVDQGKDAFANQATQQSEFAEPDPRLVEAIIRHESGGDPNAVGGIGELGLMQISPALARDLKLTPKDLTDPEINKAAGKFFLGQLLKKYNGNVEKALMAYNGGPRNVDEGTVSPAAQSYARNVLATFSNLVGPREANAAEGEVEAPAWLTGRAQTPQASPTSASPVSSDDWAKMLAKVGYGAALKQQGVKQGQPSAAPAGESLGEHLGRAYRENIAQPATQFVQQGLEKVGSYLPENPAKIPGIGLTGPAVSKNIAENFVPQTLTDAVTAGVGAVLPETRIMGEVAEGAGMLKRALSSRFGQIGATGAAGAATGKLTGEGAGQGLAKGVAVGTLGQVLRGAGGMIGRSATKGALADSYSTGVADAMRGLAPDSLGKLKTATDIFDYLGRENGEASNMATQVLSGAKAEINNRLNPGTRFKMQVFEGVDDLGKPITRTEYLTFDEADNLLSDYGKRAYNMEAAAKDNYTAGHIRALASTEKRSLIGQLDQVTPGMGKFYRNARKTYATTETLSQLAREPIYDLQTGQVDQAALSEQLHSGGYYSRLLDAVDNPKDVDKLVNAAGRGYRGAAQDIPAQPFQIRSSSVGSAHGLAPRLHPHLGSSGKPVGALPWYQRPGLTIPQLLSQGIVSEFEGEKK